MVTSKAIGGPWRKHSETLTANINDINVENMMTMAA